MLPECARGVWIGLGLLAVVVCAIAWSRSCARVGQNHEQSSSVVGFRRLDATVVRAELAARLRRATALVARQTAIPTTIPDKPSGKWKMQGEGPITNLGTSLIEPRCTLGPRELCTILDDLVRSCDAGNAGDCLAIGQDLADTPPRGMVVVTFFVQACRIGEPAGCERLDDLKADSQVPCERDPFACSYRALRTNDRELHERACALGAADSCGWMSFLTKDDVERSRLYLDAACQLGAPMACAGLGHSLQPGCTPSAQQVCYPPDPDQANAALEIACAAGWGVADDCKRAGSDLR